MNNRLKTGVKRRNIIVSGITFLAISFLLTIYFQFNNIKKAYAANSFYSLADGEWNSSVWSNTTPGGSNCSCNPGGNFNKTAYISRNISISTYAPFKLSGGGTINIVNNGKITVNSNIEISGGSLMNIDSLDTVIVNGNLLLSSSNINVSGYFRVNGNATLTGGSSVCGTGFALLNGTLSGSTWCGGIVLPINLLNFFARRENESVRLNWMTASEINNDYFTVERSTDGINFEERLKVNGSGNTTGLVEYNATDAYSDGQSVYYRLRQTDYDGKQTYSKIVAVNSKSTKHVNELDISSVYPSPFKDKIAIDYSVANKEQVNVIISKFTGVVVYQETLNAEEGKNTFVYEDTQRFSPGTYIIRLVGSNEVVAKKIVKE